MQDEPTTAQDHWHYLRGGQTPLCRRYCIVLLRAFKVEMQCGEATETQRWRWGLGILAGGAFEPLGAWPATAFDDQQLWRSLQARGVERIGALIGDEVLASVMKVAVATPEMGDAHIAENGIAVRLHKKIERAVRRDAPFMDCDSAVACVSRVLQKAVLSELSAPRRTLRAQPGHRGFPMRKRRTSRVDATGS